MRPPRDLDRSRATSRTLAGRRFARMEPGISARRFSGHFHLGVRLAARSRRAPYVDAIGGVTTACFWVRLMLFRALFFASFSIEILSDLRFAASSAGVEECAAGEAAEPG